MPQDQRLIYRHVSHEFDGVRLSQTPSNHHKRQYTDYLRGLSTDSPVGRNDSYQLGLASQILIPVQIPSSILAAIHILSNRFPIF